MSPSGLAIGDLRMVVEDALTGLDLYSLKATLLVLATQYVESLVGTRQHLYQIGGGPARGLWQIEEATHESIWIHHLAARPDRVLRVFRLLGLLGNLPSCPEPPRTPLGAKAWADRLWPEAVVGNLYYGAAMCRLKYRMISAPLPADPDDAAAYWQRYYNTTLEEPELRRARRIFRQVWAATGG